MITPSLVVKSNKLREMGSSLRQKAGAVCQRAALQCEALAKVHAPVDTGALRSSIQAEQESETAWIVAPHVDYALFQEMGTSKMAAHPFMTPAAEAVKPQFLTEMRGIVGE